MIEVSTIQLYMRRGLDSDVQIVVCRQAIVSKTVGVSCEVVQTSIYLHICHVCPRLVPIFATQLSGIGDAERIICGL